MVDLRSEEQPFRPPSLRCVSRPRGAALHLAPGRAAGVAAPKGLLFVLAV